MDLSFSKNKYKGKLDCINNETKNNPSHLSDCLDHLKTEWHQNKSVASLWQDWPKIAGNKLASNCSPVNFQHGILTIAASHPQWIQALIFNRNQLLSALQAKGHEIKGLRIKQQYPQKQKIKESEKDIWNQHPSRSDIHGKQTCPICNSPSPGGEILLWNKCSLCRRIDLSK